MRALARARLAGVSPATSVTVLDPSGVAWSERDALPTEHERVPFANVLAGRAAYEAVRDAARLAVFTPGALPPDVAARVPELVDCRPSVLLGAHPALDDLLTPGRLADLSGRSGFPAVLRGRPGREEALAALARLHFGLPEQATPLYARLAELHAEDSGLTVPPEWREAFTHALAPLAHLGLDAGELLSAAGFAAVETRLYQLSLRASLGRVEESPELVALAEARQGSGGTRLRLDVKVEAHRVPVAERPRAIETAVSVPFERALVELVTEDALRALAPAPHLEGVLATLKRKRRRHREAEVLGAAHTLLGLLYAATPGSHADPAEWLDFATRRAELDLAFHALTPELREGAARLVHEKTRQWDADFAAFLALNYPRWVRGEPRPVTGADVLRPHVRPGEATYLLVFDGMALDQWSAVDDLVRRAYGARCGVHLSPYFSVLPTATPYARNALLAGMLPERIAATFGPHVLSGNDHEETLLQRAFPDAVYVRAAGAATSEARQARLSALRSRADLKVFIFNLIDDLIHAKNLGDDRASARRLIQAGLQDSPMLEVVEAAGREGARVLITSDHGNQLTSTRARFRLERHADERPSARYHVWSDHTPIRDLRDALHLTPPPEWGLPAGADYAVALTDTRFSGGHGPYLAHGGVSLLECVIPMVVIE